MEAAMFSAVMFPFLTGCMLFHADVCDVFAEGYAGFFTDVFADVWLCQVKFL